MVQNDVTPWSMREGKGERERGGRCTAATRLNVSAIFFFLQHSLTQFLFYRRFTCPSDFHFRFMFIPLHIAFYFTPFIYPPLVARIIDGWLPHQCLALWEGREKSKRKNGDVS